MSTIGFDAFATLQKTIYLDSIEETVKPHSGQYIYYDFDKAAIRADAKASLDSVVRLLKDNPTWMIELNSHSDSKGPDKYNQKLSEHRYESAVNYLTSHGISRNRILAKGYVKQSW